MRPLPLSVPNASRKVETPSEQRQVPEGRRRGYERERRTGFPAYDGCDAALDSP